MTNLQQKAQNVMNVAQDRYNTINKTRALPVSANSSRFVKDHARPQVGALLPDVELGGSRGGGTTQPVITQPPVIPATETADCPCQEITTRKTLYLRPNAGSKNDIAIQVPYKKRYCTGAGGQKKVTVDCENEIAKILQNAGKIIK